MSNWFESMTRDQIIDFGKLIDAQEIDHVFQITADGIKDAPKNIYAPSIYHDETEDITEDGMSMNESEWTALRGYTGQYSYHGAVMHPSEYIGGRIASDMIEQSAEAESEGSPLVWVVTTAEVLPDDEEDEPDPAGWVVLYREIRPQTQAG